MSALKSLNQNAEIVKSGAALSLNIQSAKGLQEILKSNLGPRGTLKMLVGGSGDIKLTKDGSVLLGEMQIQNPTANMIARTATAQDDATGDGTTSCVLFIGELMKQAERFLAEGVHPRIIVDGFELAKTRALTFLETYKVKKEIDRSLLLQVAKTSARTKLNSELADHIAPMMVDAVLCIKREEMIDLHMIEIQYMEHQSDLDTRLVKGLVMDHGARSDAMPTRLKNCYVLTCNVSLEYDKSEVTSGFYYKNADQRQAMVDAERAFVNERVNQVIALKQKVCGKGRDTEKSFVIFNQKGIDPLSLAALAEEGIFALRRAKKRNMERLQLACGGEAMNSFADLNEDCLGWAGSVYETALGDEKYTFVEETKNPSSCTLLIKGPHKHVIAQIKECIRDGLRAIKNTLDDNCILPGGGAFNVAASEDLKKYMPSVEGRAKIGVEVFADALLVIPKTLAENGGYDAAECLIKLQDALRKDGKCVGLNLETGEPCNSLDNGVYDNYKVMRQSIHLSSVIANQLLLVDEIIKAGKQMKGHQGPPGM